VPRPSAPTDRPAAARRPCAALAAAGLALAACTAGLDVPACPGEEVAELSLEGTRTSAACAGDSVPASGSAACAARSPPVSVDCQAVRPAPDCCFDGLFPLRRAVRAVVAFGVADETAALCLQVPGAVPYLGTRAAVAGGDELQVSLDTGGAVLSACASTCAVTVHHEVTGLLARDPGTGAVTGFTGQSVEAASATASAACGACVTPCTATWTLAQAP